MNTSTGIKEQEYILFTSSNFPTGGPGAAFLNLFCKGMKVNGRMIKVYMTRGYAYGDNKKETQRKNVTAEGVSYSSLGLTKRPKNSFLKLIDDFLSLIHLLFLLPSIIRRRKRLCVVVYQTDLFHNLMIYPVAHLFRIRLVTFVPEFFYRDMFKGFVGFMNWTNFIITFNRLNPLSRNLIVFSHFLKDVYVKKGFRADDIYVLPNLTDFDFWKTPETEEKYTIGYSGTPSKKDGLIDLFKAISLLKEHTRVSLIVVGDYTFGKSVIPYLEKECESLGIRDQVHFTGLVDYSQVKFYLAQCRILAITRPRTLQTLAGFPTKLGEYMALKKAVLATDFGDLESFFINGKELVIAKSEDTVSISEKIMWMTENKDECALIAENGYMKAIDVFEFKENVKRVIDFLENE
jgi:glycosyltransferase involved in cell wall biosynthesis